jgi:hypothetical protein
MELKQMFKPMQLSTKFRLQGRGVRGCPPAEGIVSFDPFEHPQNYC